MEKLLNKAFGITCLIVLLVPFQSGAQTCEWQLAKVTYSNVDPDGGGPATGSVTFTLQVRSTGSDIPNVTGISTGWSWQSANAMLPPGSPCGSNSVPQPANITMSTAFSGFTYNNVDQCSGAVNFTVGGQTFDRRSSGTIDGGSITITGSFTDVFTVTLWTLNSSPPEGGFAVINSGSGGSPGAFATYTISDASANEYVVNSATYNTPLALTPSVALPVVFTNFDANCTNHGVLVSWSTAYEVNSNFFELQRSRDGITWTSILKIKASGNTSSTQTYHQVDPYGGTAFYRVKELDLAGNSVYTSIFRTNCPINNIGMVMYPVPARDVLNVVIRSDKSLKTQLYLIDELGKVLRQIDANLFNGSNYFIINLKGLASGQYMIRSSDAGRELNGKFNIVR